jgi:2-haloacid dehalogenase
MTRRRIVKSAGLGAAAVALRGLNTAFAQTTTTAVPDVKALIFDTFGTVVDWRGSIIEEGTAWGKAKGLTIDWTRFADRWRSGYAPAMDKVRKGQLPWTKLDDLHRMILDDLLKEFHMDGLSEAEKDHWNRVWHRLHPWPDSVAGLTRLKKKYTIAPCSNGNVALINDMAKNSGLPWDLILGAEVAHHYKPDRETYLTAVDLLGLRAQDVMMCAAHAPDLGAARSFGLRTGFIYRPDEHGKGGPADRAKPGDFDVVSTSMLDLAAKLGA